MMASLSQVYKYKALLLEGFTPPIIQCCGFHFCIIWKDLSIFLYCAFHSEHKVVAKYQVCFQSKIRNRFCFSHPQKRLNWVPMLRFASRSSDWKSHFDMLYYIVVLCYGRKKFALWLGPSMLNWKNNFSWNGVTFTFVSHSLWYAIESYTSDPCRVW